MLAKTKISVFAILLVGAQGQPLDNGNGFNSTKCRCVSTMIWLGYAILRADIKFYRSLATSVGLRVVNGTTSTILLAVAA